MQMARRHAYAYAHRALPALFFRDPAQFMTLLASDGTRFLRFYWERVAEALPAGVRHAAEGLDLRIETLDDATRVALVTLPKPEGMTEAHFLAAVHRPAAPGSAGLARYFTLEHSFMPDGNPVAILCEWTGDGKHHNFGYSVEPALAVFYRAVCGVLAR